MIFNGAKGELNSPRMGSAGVGPGLDRRCAPRQRPPDWSIQHGQTLGPKRAGQATSNHPELRSSVSQ